MSEAETPKATTTQPVQTTGGKQPPWIRRMYDGSRERLKRVVGPFIDSILPVPHYFEGETIQQVIQMAPYRKRFPKVMIMGSVGVLIPAIPFFIAGLIFRWETIQAVSGIAAVLSALLLVAGIEEWLDYYQWQFIVTDKRIILITPDPKRQNFADAIYLKRGKIQVLDTNLSRNTIWRLYQITTGSRDVMLSMAGYEFLEEGAQVKGGLRFPDVVPEDITKLEILIFG